MIEAGTTRAAISHSAFLIVLLDVAVDPKSTITIKKIGPGSDLSGTEMKGNKQ
jgi:hypothetical protein